MRLTQVTLEEFDNGRREVEGGCPIQHILLRQIVADHELGKVTDL